MAPVTWHGTRVSSLDHTLRRDMRMDALRYLSALLPALALGAYLLTVALIP